MNPPDQLIDDLRLLEPPEPLQIDWLLVSGALAALLLALWLFRIWRAGATRRGSVRALRNARKDALRALEQLFSMVAEEQSRPYAIESSAIIRRYLEEGFGLQAPRRATDEFLAEAQHSPLLTAEQQGNLGEFLRCCDLLKFARAVADRPELEQLHDAAVMFVRTAQPSHEEVAA